LNSNCGGVRVAHVRVKVIKHDGATTGTVKFEPNEVTGAISRPQYPKEAKQHFAAQFRAGLVPMTTNFAKGLSKRNQDACNTMVNSALSQTASSYTERIVPVRAEAPLYVYQVEVSYSLSDGGYFKQQSRLATTIAPLMLKCKDYFPSWCRGAARGRCLDTFTGTFWRSVCPSTCNSCWSVRPSPCQ